MTRITILIEPKPQSRPRLGKFGTYEDPKMKAWRRQVSGYIAKHYKGEFFTGAISVDVTFYMKAPKTMSKEPTARTGAKRKAEYERFVNEQIPHDKKIDLDNLEKSLYDSLSNAGNVWVDDCLVVQHTTRKIYSPVPRIEVKIEKYEKKDYEN